jgi:hypothetical protein
MTHELVMIEQEYMTTWIGCCVSPGVGVTVRVNGSTANLGNVFKTRVSHDVQNGALWAQ